MVLHNRGQTNTCTPSECHRTRARYVVRIIECVFLFFVLQEELRVYVCLRLAGCRIYCIVLLVFASIYQLATATHNGISVRIVQFPIRLHYAVSVHRSQGQTLSRVMLDLRRNPLVNGCCWLLCRGYVILAIS